MGDHHDSLEPCTKAMEACWASHPSKRAGGLCVLPTRVPMVRQVFRAKEHPTRMEAASYNIKKRKAVKLASHQKETQPTIHCMWRDCM